MASMTISTTKPTSAEEHRQSLLSRATAFFVFLFEKVIPDPYVFAVLLTFAGVALARVFAPNATLPGIASAWYGGIFAIFAFAFQMVIMLVAGYALAMAPPVHKLLARIAGTVSTPLGAISLTVVVSLIASWLNWGLGLVTSALLAREMAKRVRFDFGWLVAAAYTGFVVSTEGLSGSIALSQATHGSVLNVVEKVTGRGVPLSQTVFSRFNLVPCLVLLIILPVIFRYLQPSEKNTVMADPDRLRKEDEQIHTPERTDTLGSRLDNAWILNLALVLFGVFALVMEWSRKGFSLDLNSVIICLVLGGLLLHWRPSAYIGAVKHAARISGSLVLQYPLYGGLMGIITTTGLAGVLSKIFIKYSTVHTLPFFTYLTSMIITLFVPSGGGHWAVQGPFAVPAAVQLHSSLAGTTMAVAMGESVANMLQPFWALPILAIAGIPMRRVMGFMVVTFCVSAIVFGLSLLFLIPQQ
jgi:short-chain fatty acids transporter